MAERKNKSLEDALERLRERIDAAPRVKPGEVELHLTGKQAGDYRIGLGQGKATVSAMAGRPTERRPTLEVWGDADTIRAILDGDKDPVKQFLVGGMRVRGDLRYLSEMGVELGILDKPL